MVQETTSGRGDPTGSVNPTGSKSRQGAFEGGPPEHPGRTLEAVGNGCRRWMAVTADRVTGRRHRTRRIGRLIPDITSVNAAIVNAKDGKVIDETWSGQPIGLDLASERTFASIRTTLPGVKVGSRVLIVSPPKDAFGDQGRDSIGVAPTDSVIFVLDILGATQPIDQAEGTAVAPKAGLPTVEWHADRPADVTIPKGAKAPAKLVVQKLIEGTGAEVKKGANVRVSYTGVLWDGGKSFDSSMTKDPAWFEFAVGAGQVIPGWDKGLTGAKVGDRLLLVIPPADGYGAQGNPQASPPIKGTDTLVFVVDVLATY